MSDQAPFELWSRWWLVIETNCYAGNFERQMVAWCTGSCGETHGAPEAMEFIETFKEDAWALMLDDRIGYCSTHGERATLWPLPKKPRSTDGHNSFFTGVAIPFEERPTHREMRFVLDRALDYAEKVRTGYFDDKDGISRYTQKTLQVKGVHVMQTRLNQSVTSRLGVKNLKKYQRSKKNPRS